MSLPDTSLLVLLSLIWASLGVTIFILSWQTRNDMDAASLALGVTVILLWVSLPVVAWANYTILPGLRP